MKKIVTDLKNFGALRMLDQFLHGRQLQLSDQGAEEFTKGLQEVIRQHRANAALVHGFRAQTMFAYLAAALGGCKIITEEDSGEFYTDRLDYKRPDFRILTHAGEEFFVEAKNFHQKAAPLKPFVLKADYVKRLLNYSEAFQKPILFAIYWVRWGTWTLNPLSDFLRTGSTYSLAFVDSHKNDHKYLLGDFMIGIPKPLSLRFYTDPAKPRNIGPDGHVQFTIGRVVFVVGGKEVVDDFEKKLAGFFLFYAPWENVEEPVTVVDGEVIYFDIQGSKQDGTPEQNFLILGHLSEMISRQFDDLTIKEGNVTNLTPAIEPDKLGVVIPPDFKGNVMSIWRFEIQPERPIFQRKNWQSGGPGT